MRKNPSHKQTSYQPKWVDYGMCGGCGQKVHIKVPSKGQNIIRARCPVCNRELEMLAEGSSFPQMINLQSATDVLGTDLD